MNKQLIIYWLSRIVLLIYTIINIDIWLQVLFPHFYNDYFSKLCVYEVYDIIGGWLLFIVIALIILHITHILRIEKKVFWIMLIVFLFNLVLMYLEIRKN